METAEPLQAAYDGLYSDRMTAWRALSAKYKVQHIQQVCRGRRFSKVLDCGAGEGAVLAALAAKGAFTELHAIEISDSGLEQIAARKLPALAAAVKFDGYRIPYPDKTFDMAYCSHVLEHVEHPRLLLRELARVSAHQVFEIPLDYNPRVDRDVAHYLGYGHINIFTPATFKFLLQSEGFEIGDELLTHTPLEVARFDLYENQRKPKTLSRELRLHLEPLLRIAAQVRYGRAYHDEVGYSAFTCIARSTGALKVF